MASAHLCIKTLTTLPLRSSESAETVNARIESSRSKLLQARNLRVWPARDEKILTAWNALMIKGLAIASRVLDRPDLAREAAGAAVDHSCITTSWRDGRLLATRTRTAAAHRCPAYLDDYSFLAGCPCWKRVADPLAQQRPDIRAPIGRRAARATSKMPTAADFFFTAKGIMRNSFTAAKTFGDEIRAVGQRRGGFRAVPPRDTWAGRGALPGCRRAQPLKAAWQWRFEITLRRT